MSKKSLMYAVAIAVMVLVFLMAKDTFDQPGIEDMKAGFKEVVMYRNANNTGPVQRIYVVTVQDSVWKEMQDYGNLMPHTKYGNTKVYFFMKNSEVPKTLQPGNVNFDTRFNLSCIALYEKSAMSQVVFNKNPLK